MITIFILIYLISFAIHLILEYRENKRFIHDVGDLIDNIHFYMWFPLLNTLILIVAVVSIFIMKLRELLKLDILWQKFRNIRLR
jgi:hypothetical protein